MLNILRASQSRPFQSGGFRINRVRPGQAIPALKDNAFGPLSVIDHANLSQGTIVRMHEHNNDEIFSYLWRGSMVHEDSAGQRATLSADNLMLMNAGKSFWHEESTPFEANEMLQIFIRPWKADLEGQVQFMQRPAGIESDAWTLLVAPEGETAPLNVRQHVYVFDRKLNENSVTEIPFYPGMGTWLYVLDGEIETGEHVIRKGDALASEDESLPAIKANLPTIAVCFLVKLDATSTNHGTISGAA
ncbi:TPA: pirin family protein [Citrobacter koseri]